MSHVQISEVQTPHVSLMSRNPSKHLVHLPLFWSHSRQYDPHDTQDMPILGNVSTIEVEPVLALAADVRVRAGCAVSQARVAGRSR